MALNVAALLKEVRHRPLKWIDDVEERLENGWLGDPRQLKVDSYKTGQSYKWVDVPQDNIAKSINSRVIEVMAWWVNNIMDYRDYCLEKERYNYADVSAKVLDGYKDFLNQHCPKPVKGYYRFHGVQGELDDKFSVDVCVFYYRISVGLAWTETEGPVKKKRRIDERL